MNEWNNCLVCFVISVKSFLWLPVYQNNHTTVLYFSYNSMQIQWFSKFKKNNMGLTKAGSTCRALGAYIMQLMLSIQIISTDRKIPGCVGWSDGKLFNVGGVVWKYSHLISALICISCYINEYNFSISRF